MLPTRLGPLLGPTVIGLLAYASAAAALPDQPCSGRWRMDTASMVDDAKPTGIRLVDGGFQKDDNEVVRADGQLHHVAGDGYVDEQSITIENDHQVKEVDRIRGKVVYTVDYVVSSGGDSLTMRIISYTSPNGQPVPTESIHRRIGVTVPLAHIISGDWKRVAVVTSAKNDWFLKLDGNHFSSRTEGGIGYDAVVGGGPVPIDGDNSGARAQITRPRADTIVETGLSVKGAVDDTMSLQLMPDRNTIRATAVMPTINRTSTFLLHRVAE